jgi:curved DNA-binding protein CbpA
MNADEIRSILRQKYDLLESEDWFALLEVDEKSSPDEVKDAYFRLVKVLHPDRLARSGIGDAKTEANQVFRGLTAAFNTLNDPRQRAAYVARRKIAQETGEPGAIRDQGSSMEDVRIYTHRGELMLKRRAYPEAETFFRKALELAPKEAHLYIKLGSAVFYNEQRDKKPREEDARKLWEKAQELADNRAEALYHLAIYWKARGEMQKVEDNLRDALALQPGYVEAKRELRLLSMRRRNARKRGFIEKLLSGFRKKSQPEE